MTEFLFHFICVYFFIFDDGKSTFFDMFGFKEPLFNCPPPDGFPSNSVDKALAIKTKNPTTLSMLLALGLCSSQLCNTYQLTVEARLCFLLFQLGKTFLGIHMTSRVYFQLVQVGTFLQQSRKRQLTNFIGGLFIRPQESEHVNDMTRFNRKRNSPDITVH